MASIEHVTIREYRPGDGPGIVDLLNEVFAEGDQRYEPRTLEQWRWIYEDNPAGRQVIVAEDPTGRIVGQYACIPYRVVVRGERFTCGQGVDSMVAKEYRRGLQSEGLFLRTARRYFADYGRSEVNAYGYGFPNAKAFRIGVRMLAYVPIHAPVTTLGRNLFVARDDLEVEVGADPAEVVPIDRFDDSMDRLWDRLEAEIPMATVRDARFLNWRYLDCPFAPYRAFGLREPGGGLRGVYVSRDDWTGPPILAISELLVPGADTGGALRLLAHAVSQARERGQQRVEVWIPPHHPLFPAVEAHGFTPEPSPFNLCIKIYDPAIEADWVRRSWFYSMGDTDVF